MQRRSSSSASGGGTGRNNKTSVGGGAMSWDDDGSSSWTVMDSSTRKLISHLEVSTSTKQFALRISQTLSSEVLVTADQELVLQRALQEQNFTITQLNLAELELYGREHEVSILQEALDTVVVSAASSNSSPTNSKAIVSILGHAGTGKTRLSQEFKRYVHKKDGLFLSGKFDAQNRQEPYSAIISALSELPRQVETRGTSVKHKVCKRLREAMGDETHLLTSLVPELTYLIGIDERRTSEVVAYSNRTNQLQYLFRQFMKALCTPDQPVVMVLDDMQWTDSSTLSLVWNLISDPTLSSFLLVTTCREEEVEDHHPFLQQLKSLQNDEGIRVRTVRIGNLDQSAVLSIVSTALRSSEETTFKLSEIVHQKSNGNAWYVIQFLRTLYDEGLLKYNLGLMQWTWEESKVRSQFVMDNVVDLTAAKIRRLPPSSQNVLQIASCLGQTFDMDHLEFVIQEPRVKAIFHNSTDNENPNAAMDGGQQPAEHWPNDLVQCLKGLVNEAVIDFISQLKCYCFVHDLIQEAAFALIPEEKSARIQSEVGRRLLRSREHLGSSKLGDQYFFRAIDLSNAGSEFLDDDDEKLALAHYNLEAGERAMEQAAFASALKYTEQGLKFLGPYAWTTQGELTLSLTSGAVEAAYCCGDFESMEVHMASVLQREDLPIEDKVRVYLTRILSYGAQDKNLLALDTGRYVLKQMGVTKLPKRPGLHHVVIELIKTKLLLKNHTESSLLALPTLTDERWLQAMSIVDMMTAIAYTTDINFFTVMTLRTMRWLITHGVCRYAPTGFSAYGMVMCALGEVKAARMYADVAIALSERLNARMSVAKTIVCIYGFNHHWTSNLRMCLKPLLYGHKNGMECGEVEIAMYNVAQHGEALLVTAASPLKALVPKLRSNANLMREHNQEGSRTFQLLALQFALKLLGPCDDPHRFSGDVLNEDDARTNITAIGNQVAECFLEYYCLQLAYYFEDYKSADRYSYATRDFAKATGGHFLVPRTAFFQGLTALALAGQGIHRLRNLRAATRILKQLKKWSDAGNVNCIHTVHLMEAEFAAVRDRRPEAIRSYWKAINAANRNGYLNDKALAHERAFLFHLRIDPDDLFWAQSHYNDAIQAYCDWNAFQKARHLVLSYANRFDPSTALLSPSFSIPDSDAAFLFLGKDGGRGGGGSSSEQDES